MINREIEGKFQVSYKDRCDKRMPTQLTVCRQVKNSFPCLKINYLDLNCKHLQVERKNWQTFPSFICANDDFSWEVFKRGLMDIAQRVHDFGGGGKV